MNFTMNLMNPRLLTVTLGSIALSVGALTACGKPSQIAEAKRQGMIPVSGAAGFGTQCPFGTISPVTATKVQMWDCPIGLEKVALNQPLEPLVLQVDCKKKTLTIRKEGRTMDTSWEIYPDGSFHIDELDGGTAQLSADGPQRPACTAPLTAVVMGKVDCTDVDRAKLQFETVWWLGKSQNADRDQALFTATSGVSKCSLPQSCYLYSTAQIQQCE